MRFYGRAAQYLLLLLLLAPPAQAQSHECRSDDPDIVIEGCSADIKRDSAVEAATGMLPVYYSMRAAAYQKKDMFEKARDDHDMAVSLQPGFRSYFNRAVFFSDYGMATESMNDYATAIAFYEKVTPPDKSLEEPYVQANMQRADALRRSDRFADALVNYDKAVALRPDNLEALYNRALANSRLERVDAVITDLSRVIDKGRRQSFYVSALINRGLAYMRKADFAAAIADLDRALETEPGSPLALVRRGYVFEQAGQRDKAIADYRAALGLYARMEESLAGLKRLGQP